MIKFGLLLGWLIPVFSYVILGILRFSSSHSMFVNIRARRRRPFSLSFVSQQLATWIESIFFLLLGTSLFHLGDFVGPLYIIFLVPGWWKLFPAMSVLYIICILKIFSISRHDTILYNTILITIYDTTIQYSVITL